MVLPTHDADGKDNSNNNDPEFIGKAIATGLVRLALFPFGSTVKLIIYIVSLVIFNLVELIIGFATLGTRRWNGTGTFHFLQAYLITDSLVSLIELLLHILLLYDPATSLLSNLQSIPSITRLKLIPMENAQPFFPNNSTYRTYFVIRTLIGCITIIFHFVWNFIALIFVTTTVAVVCVFFIPLFINFSFHRTQKCIQIPG